MADAEFTARLAAVQAKATSSPLIGDTALVIEFLILLANMIVQLGDEVGGVVASLQNVEVKLMADETKFSADVVQFSADLDELAAGVQALKDALAVGNTTAAQEEADKLTLLLDPIATKARATAAQFDTAPAPAPVPPVTGSHR
jgi:hypothetical protein